MIRIVCTFGVAETTTHECPQGTTIGELKADSSLKARLGYGDNVKCLINGVSIDDDAEVPAGATVRFETAANQKAA